MFIRFDVAFLIATSFSLILLVRCKIEDVRNEVIPSGGIKSDMNSCNLQKDQNGVQKKYCYIRNDNTPAAAKYFKREQEKTGKSCKLFKLSDFSENTPSIMYGEANGRIGNQLMGYAQLLQLGVQLGVSTYMDYDMKEQLTAVFTPESIDLPILYDTYCNPQDIPWEMWRGKMDELLTNKNLRKGRFLYTSGGGYRPEDHLGPETDSFQRAYVQNLRSSLKFHQRIQTRVNLALHDVAMKMQKKPKDVTYIGIHNRRTDFHKHLLETMRKTKEKKQDYEELGKDYFMDGMEYFRDEYDNIAFIYSSDDMPWGYKNLEGVKDLHFLGIGQNLDEETRKEIGDPDAAAYDFALLVNCNHTITTRGTYSMWISLLTGGEYYSEYGPIVPPHDYASSKS